MPSTYLTLQFGLHPERLLNVSLHRKLKKNPHTISKMIASLTNDNHKRFAIMDATRIISVDHIAIAANNALMRISDTDNRGIALDTVICAAGSTNVMSVMKEYAFDQHSDAAKEENNCTGYNVLLLAFDCKADGEILSLIEQLGLGEHDSLEDTHSFFARQRSNDQMSALMKAYKITKEEVEMRNSSLESAIINRLATKYL
jgi:hypothetical protein